MNFQELIRKLPKSIEFKNNYHYLQISFQGEYLCSISFGDLFFIDVLYDSDLTKQYLNIRDLIIKYEIINNQNKKVALDGSIFGPFFTFILDTNPDIKTFSTNRLSKLTEIELRILCEKYNVKMDESFDTSILFETIRKCMCY